MNLMKRLNALVERYINTYINAPTKWGQRVFGQQLPTKSDIRRDFLKNLNMLAEVAAMTQDKEVLNRIKCVMEDNYEDELNKLRSTLSKDR